MNDETKIKLQAYLDGELSDREAREISGLLDKDAEAQSLLSELQMVKRTLHGNELEIAVPESREFYWGKIQREIEQGTKRAPASSSLFSWWKPTYIRLAGGFAAVCTLLMVSFIAFDNDTRSKYASVPGEIEGNGEMGAITYHSNSEGMTVVYLFDREPAQMVDSQSN